MAQELKRKLSAILSADVKGYSPLIQIRVYFIFLLAISWVSFTLLGCNGSSNGGSNDSSGDAPSPPEVTNLTLEKVKSKRVTLSWKNPLYDDLDKIEITYPEITTPIEVGKDLQIVDIIVPLNSVKYSFLVRTVSKAGGKSNGICISATATGKLIYRGSSLHQMGACYCGPCDYGSYYQYDSDDDLIKITTYKLNAEGECLLYDPPLLSTYEIYEYDELGNNISMLYYDKNDNLID